MTTTISGHTIPVDDLANAERLHEFATHFSDDHDALERWLYAGAPEIDKACPRCGDAETWHESKWGWDFACGSESCMKNDMVRLFSADGIERGFSEVKI